MLLSPDSYACATLQRGRSRSWLSISTTMTEVSPVSVYFPYQNGSGPYVIDIVRCSVRYEIFIFPRVLFSAINSSLQWYYYICLQNVGQELVRKAEWSWRTDHKSRQRRLQQFDSKRREFDILSGPDHFLWLRSDYANWFGHASASPDHHFNFFYQYETLGTGTII